MTIDYRDYQPKTSSRVRENIEWTTTRTYNALDTDNPRILLLGDSICNGYHEFVRENLAQKANISFWATSKCLTDPDYFRELDFIIDSYPVDMVTFNNGAHSPSQSTKTEEWDEHFIQAIKFIQAKLPNAKLLLITTTPSKDETRNIQMKRLNETVHTLAKSENIPLLDFYEAMDPIKDEALCDKFHFHEVYRKQQADMISEKICELLNLEDQNITQESTETGPAGAVK